jgi:hypothetical protein
MHYCSSVSLGKDSELRPARTPSKLGVVQTGLSFGAAPTIGIFKVLYLLIYNAP